MVHLGLGPSRKDIEEFNKTGKLTKIKDVTPYKLKKLLENLDTTKKTLLQNADTFYTLNPKNQQHLLENIENFFTNTPIPYGSDAAIIINNNDIKDIVIVRPKDKHKDKNEGAFFKYYNKTNIDLTEFGIYTEKQHDYKENCFVQSLIALNVEENIINEIRSIICSKYLPTNKLKKIAEKFNLYIRIKPINDKHKTSVKIIEL